MDVYERSAEGDTIETTVSEGLITIRESMSLGPP